MKDIIDIEKIKNGLIKDTEIIYYETTDSTNTRLKELAKSGGKTGTVVIAENQTSGRGRLGRAFYSPTQSGIYMSLLIQKDDISNIGLLTAHTAVAVCDAIEKVYFHSKNPTDKSTFGIKWVNDILKNGKKICGILAESVIEDNQTSFIIVGIGINVYSPKEGFPEEIKDIADSIFTSTIPNARNMLIAEIINNFYTYSPDFVSTYRKKSTVIGKHINVHTPDDTKKAFATGIDDNCNLLVKYENGETGSLSFGEISIRTI